MKIFLFIFVFGFLMCERAYTDEKIYSNSSNYVKNLVSNLTVAKIIEQTPASLIEQAPTSLHQITSDGNGLQYHFFITMKNVIGMIPVICYVNIKSTTCIVP